MVKSSHIDISMNFKVEKQKNETAGRNPRIRFPEAFAIGLSNHLYRIQAFHESIPVFDLRGYGIVFFKSEEGYIVHLKQFEDQTLYNLPAIYEANYKRDPRLYCKHDYTAASNDVQISLNFETENLHIYINGKSCIEYKINQRLFPEPKVALSFVGYSGELSPIQIRMNEVSIYKGKRVSAQELEPVFHNDVDTFIHNLDKYDPLHGSNASFSNIMLTQVS